MSLGAFPSTDPSALDPTQLASYVRPGPRYTSYPPATEFARHVGSSQAKWHLDRLRGEQPAAPISLYCHVPYCSRLCWYCGCNVVVTRDRTRASAYIDTLCREVALLAAALRPGWPVAELALGGGSPNFVPANDLARLVAAIESEFVLLPGAVLGIELDPRDTSDETVALLARLGFTRLSVGVQDFSPAVQQAINRRQSVAQTAHLIVEARRHGFSSVNVDLVYGLPRQTPVSFAATLDAVIGLGPDQVALFGYAHLPHRLRHQRLVERAGPVPGGRQRAELLALGLRRFAAAGYARIGLDHFALPDSPLVQAAASGRLRRNFQGYTVCRAEHVLACGTTAISDCGTAYWQNHAHVDDWSESIHRGELPVGRGIELDRDDQIRRFVIMTLMCRAALDFTEVEERWGLSFECYFAAELDRLGRERQWDALIELDREGRRLIATDLGCNLIRNVCMVFDRFLSGDGAQGQQPRFSPTL